RYFRHPLQNANDGWAIALYLALTLNIVFHVARVPCAIVLELINFLLTGSRAEKIIPFDIRDAREKFDLDPVKDTFASCLSCNAVHEPTREGGLDIFP
ncbi:hypothetical protein DFP72DRAFT_756254, partial [Ephemerocybe angulata]